MIKQILYGILFLFLFSSCFKEDDPLPPFPEKTTTIEMTQYYRYQFYFDLGTNSVVSSNDKSIWDLGFECADSTWHIRLNTSAFMMAANTGLKDFEAVTDTTGMDWRFDTSDGNPDSTAVGEWLEMENEDTLYFNHVYIIDRGLDHLGVYRGFRKIVFTKVDESGYYFRYARLDGSDYNEYHITRDPERNYINFSFENNGETLALEPPTTEWDLLFTMYTTLLYTDEGEPYPYILTGVLSNYGSVEIAFDSIIAYKDIQIDMVNGLDFSEEQDVIGYDWKYLDGDPTQGGSFSYQIHENWNYIIKNRNEVYFKLRFVRFYSDTGEKGYPTFTYSVL
ncbi:MAG: HmuY family protein [Bacteroidales bacterium]|nr:HmuY family protein [Bacteroidales bacterium]MCF8403717.1 HmuY family protein [Bacteroidales bacterium]